MTKTSLLEAILETAAGAILSIDAHGIIHTVNPAALKLFGYAQDELIGHNVSKLMPDPDHSRHDQYIHRHIETGERRIIGSGRETQARHKTGALFPIHLSVSRFEVDGQLYFAGIIHDLSARTRLEAEIDRQALLFQTVFDHVPEALLIADPTFQVLLQNPAAERLLGPLTSDHRTEALASLFDLETEFERISSGLDAASRSGRPAATPASAKLKGATGNTFPSEVIAAEIASATTGVRTGIVVLVRDLTDELRREEALLKSQRLEAIGQLTGGIAHDFNNLLTIVSGNLELMESYLTDPKARDHADRALKASEAGARLTNRLLTFARRRRLEPEASNLNDQVRLMTELLRRTIGEAIQLSTVLQDDLWTVRADVSEIENAILNLAINARDALPHGGRVIIETRNATLDGVHDDRDGLLNGDYVRLSVSDNGVGMTRDVMARAFEPFFTTKPTGRGTGLGLSTIYGFARQSNGDVSIYSEPGRGTTVNIYLPRHAAQPPALKGAQKAAPETPTRGVHILVVEDNPEVLAVSVARLERLGHTVESTTNGPDAIERLKRADPIDAVFSDVVMPGGLSGFDIARWLRANRPDVPILLTTGFAEDIARQEQTDIAEVPILRKPYSQLELDAALRHVLASKQ